MQAAVDATVLAFGGLDLVVNNAGLSLSKALLDTTVADWDLQHNVMAKGSFLVSRAAAKVLIEQKLGGDIIYISSKNSIFAGPNNIAYSATKADQAHQVRLLAAELGEHGVKVNGINPDGVVRGSGIFAGGWGAKRAAVYGVDEEDLGKYYAQRTLLKREVLPENVANAVFVLCTSRPQPHHRPPHPRRRRSRRRLPPMNPTQPRFDKLSEHPHHVALSLSKGRPIDQRALRQAQRASASSRCPELVEGPFDRPARASTGSASVSALRSRCPELVEGPFDRSARASTGSASVSCGRAAPDRAGRGRVPRWSASAAPSPHSVTMSGTCS